MQLIEPIIIAEQRMFDAITNFENAKVSDVMPQLKLMAHQNGLNLKRVADFQKAADILILSTYLN